MVILDPFLVCVAFLGFLPIMMRFSSFFVQSFLEFRCYLLQCRLEHSREEHRPQVSSKHKKEEEGGKEVSNKNKSPAGLFVVVVAVFHCVMKIFSCI